MKVDMRTGIFCCSEKLDTFPENNIVLVVCKFNRALHDYGVSLYTLLDYSKYGLNPLLKYYEKLDCQTYSYDISRRFMEDCQNKCKSGIIKECTFNRIRRVVTILERYVSTGNIDLSNCKPRSMRLLNSNHTLLLDDFVNDLQTTGEIADSTIHNVWSVIRGFLLTFEDAGISDIKRVDNKNFSDCMTIYASRYKGGIDKMAYSVRLFLKYLYREKYIEVDLSKVLPRFAEYRKHNIEAFTNEEIQRILDMIDPTTSIGKRDLAALTLAAETSLRAVDIAKIKRQDIDWHKNELRVIQSKTGQGVIYPLLTESGNAIADYLLNGRPEGGEPYIFLTHQGVPRPIGTPILIQRLKYYMMKASVPSNGRAFHSFRRSVATNLLDNEVPLELLKQILGQREYRSTKPYLSINEKGLQQCCISFPLQQEIL